MEIKINNKCRLCNGDLVEVLDYGMLPLANALALTKQAAMESKRYEQKLMFCESCFLGQLSVVIDPEILYKDYVYHSSVSKVFTEHCKELAREIPRKLNTTVIDIAGNDGALAKEICEWNSEAKVFVIDPAQNEIPRPWTKIKKFWNKQTADEFINEFGKADTVTAQNVIGHVDEIVGFFRAVNSVLKPDGVFIVEIPSFIELLRTAAFETVYHEHVSYWTETTMIKLAIKTGFELFKVEHIPIHCGSFRFYLRPGVEIERRNGYEKEFFSNNAIDNFQRVAKERISLLTHMTNELLYDNIISVSASAKSIVLLNMIGADFINYSVDDTPEKQGKFIPGIAKEVRPFTIKNVKDAEAAFIFSRNLTVPLFNRLHDFGFSGITVAG